MIPPAYNDGNFPFRLYLSGGYLVNLISAVFLFVLFAVLGPASFAGRMFVLGGAVALYLELLLHGRKEEIEKLATKEVLSFLTATASTLPSSVRTVYAYEKLYHHDEKALAKAEKQFANVVKNYPNLGELQQEQMLVEKVDEVARRRTGVK